MARILVADDNAEIRHLVGSILTEDGHKVSFAQDGQEALDMIVAEGPDLVILDIMMPKKDGYMVMKEMKASGVREGTKVMILTAKTAESEWVRGYKLGADQYVTKPFRARDLGDAVTGILQMSKDQLRHRREQELDKAQLLARLESMFEGT